MRPFRLVRTRARPGLRLHSRRLWGKASVPAFTEPFTAFSAFTRTLRLGTVQRDRMVESMSARILIADDNPVARGRLSKLLQYRGGWEVCAAVENGQQALARAAELHPDLIIMDLAMPDMNELAPIRELARTLPTVPILIFTLYVATWLSLEAKKAGASDVVSKGNAETLLAAVENIMTKDSSTPPA